MLQNVDDVYPLTATQQGMLYHTLSDPASGVYVNQVLTPISGNLDVSRFEQAWAAVLARHETLRTAFLWDGLDDPLQVVRSEVRTEWRHLDLAGSSISEQDRQLATFLEDDRRRGFDLGNPPLCRMALVRLGSSEWKWIWSFHHLILDGWSANLILDELFATYGSTSPDGAELADPPKYRDFVALHLSRDEGDEEAFWRTRLAGFTEPHRLDVPGLRPVKDASGFETHSFDLGTPALEALGAAARELNVTLNTVFLGAWALVLSRWTRSTDVVFGTTMAGRPSSLAGIEHATGLFINTLPQRIQVPPSEQLGPWLRAVQRGQIETRDHEQSSLASIQRWCEVEGGRPLFESILVFENYPRSVRTNRFAGIEVGAQTYIEQSNYPLAVLVTPGESLAVSIVYDTARFAPEAIEGLGEQLRTLLSQVAAAPDGRLAGLSLVSTEDRDRLRTRTTGPAMVEDDRCVHDIIESVADGRPAAPAVIFEGRSLSYEALEQQATRLAAKLQAAGVGPNRPVGLYLPRSTGMIVGLLAILKAGGAYVPLDPAYPAEHIRLLLDNDAIDIVLTNEDLRRAVPPTVDVVSTDEAGGEPEALKPTGVGPTDLAYVIHTSGSTGRPKGVMVTHRNLVHSTLARNIHYGQPVGRFLLLSSFAFDSSVAGIFWTLCTGGTLVLPAPGTEQDIDQLLALAADTEITHLLCLPALYQLLAEHSAKRQLASLQVAIVAGEVCPSTVLEWHLERAPHAQLHNEYGPTEATVWCSVHHATATDVGRPLPIGRPIAGTRIYLLDESGQQVPSGFAGELCVAGSGVAGGYLGREDLTAERFVTVEIDGAPQHIYRTGDLACYGPGDALLFLGRTDVQMKVRGHRIEPGAVEAALRSHSSVREAVVSSWSSAGESAAQLIGYLVLDGDALDSAAMRRYLREKLPAFMVPDMFIPLEVIPRLPNGKVDVGALPDPAGTVEGDPHSFVPPRSEAELKLAGIWADVLGVDVEAIGADSDFFRLGGHSLLAIRLMSAVHTTFGTSLPLAALFDAPRLSELATLLERGRRPSRAPVFVPIREAGEETLFLVHPVGGNVLIYEPLARHLPDELTVIGIQAWGVEGTEEPDRTIKAMAVRYAKEIMAQPPSGPINLAGYSTGGLIVFEMARILEEEGQKVGLVALLDTYYPVGPGLRTRLTRDLEMVRAGKWQGVRGVADLWWSSFRGLAGRVRHGPRWRYLLSRNRPLPPGLAGKRITHIGLKAVRFSISGRYGGTVTFIRALGDGTRFHDSIPRWQAVAGELIVRDSPGHHTGDGNMVSEPHAGVLATIIVELLSPLGAGRAAPGET
jgi:amino acid adenylation domain-containing protein